MSPIRADEAGQSAGFSSTLMFRAARWYYEDSLSQQEIADRLQTHRSTVSRLLQMARERDIVQIRVVEPTDVVSLSEELAQLLNLRRVVVVEATGSRGSSSSATVESLVEPTLRELADLNLGVGDVMGVSWGNAVWRVASAQTDVALTGVEMVPVIGGLDETEPQFQTNEIVRLFAQHTKANVNFLHLPARLSSSLRRDLLKERTVGPRLAMWNRLDAALVGIGSTDIEVSAWPKSAQVKRGVLAVAAGDVAGRYFDLDGRPVPVSDEDDLVVVSPAQLKKARSVLAVAAGPAKVPSIVGASRSRMIDILVTDSSTAEMVRKFLET